MQAGKALVVVQDFETLPAERCANVVDGCLDQMKRRRLRGRRPGSSSAAGANAPGFFEITQTIVGGTGRFEGASGGGTGRVNLAAGAVITVSGTITRP